MEKGKNPLYQQSIFFNSNIWVHIVTKEKKKERQEKLNRFGNALVTKKIRHRRESNLRPSGSAKRSQPRN